MTISEQRKTKGRKRVKLWMVFCLLVFASLFYYFDCHWILIGYFKNQPSYKGLPAQYWRQRIIEHRYLLGHSHDLLPGAKIQVLNWLNQDPYAAPLRAADKQAVPLLLFLVKDENSQVRSFAVSFLAEIRPPDDETIAALMQALDDETWDVRFDALLSLAMLGPDGRAAFPKLLDLLGRKEETDLRPLICGTLHAIDPDEAKQRNIPTMLDTLAGEK